MVFSWWLRNKNKKSLKAEKSNKKNVERNRSKNNTYENVPDQWFIEAIGKFMSRRQQQEQQQQQQQQQQQEEEEEEEHDNDAEINVSNSPNFDINNDQLQNQSANFGEVSYYENITYLNIENCNDTNKSKYYTPIDDVAHSTERIMITDLDASLYNGLQHAMPIQIEPNEIKESKTNDESKSCINFYTFPYSEQLREYFGDIFIINEQQLQYKGLMRNGPLNTFTQKGEFNGNRLCVITSHYNNNYNILCHNFEMLRKCRHPNILLLMGIILNDSHKISGILVEPFKHSLYSNIYPKKSLIPLKQCFHYIAQLTNAVIYLHSRNIIHTSICTENVVISHTSHLLKLTGFEVSISLDMDGDICCTTSCQMHYRQLYTKHFYQAPECLMEHFTANESSDTYGLCIILWELLNCTIPFVQYTRNELRNAFAKEQASLVTLQKKRSRPFQLILEKGLAIKQCHRFSNALNFKNALLTLKTFNWDIYDRDDDDNDDDKVVVPCEVHITGGVTKRQKCYNINIKVRSIGINDSFLEDLYIDDDFNNFNAINLGLG